MNPVFNSEERRLRAGLRIPLFIILFIILMSLTTFVPFLALQYVVSLIVLFTFFWFSYRFIDNRVSIKEAGLELNKVWWKDFAFGSTIGLIAMSLIFLVEWFSGDLEISGFAWERVSDKMWLLPVLAYLIQHLSVGFYEEFMARSYLIPNFKEGFTLLNISPVKAMYFAVFFSSAIFGLLHATNPNVSQLAVLNIIVAGVMLALPYILTGRLAISVGLHFMWNFAQGGIFGFRVSGTEPMQPVIDIQQGGNALWTGGAFGPEGGFIGLAAMILIVCLMLVYIRRIEGDIRVHSYFKRTFTENQQSLGKADELA